MELGQSGPVGTRSRAARGKRPLSGYRDTPGPCAQGLDGSVRSTLHFAPMIPLHAAPFLSTPSPAFMAGSIPDLPPGLGSVPRPHADLPAPDSEPAQTSGHSFSRTPGQDFLLSLEVPQAQWSLAPGGTWPRSKGQIKLPPVREGTSAPGIFDIKIFW